jgi:serine/threonine-protein kinase
MNVRNINSADYIGKDFGNITIVKEIGRGAMGIVLLGYQKTLKRQVAVKILPKAVNHDASTWELFRDEAETVAVLSHPNIVPIFEMGENEDCYFQVMLLIEGENLRTIIKSRLNHPLPSKRLIPLHETADILITMLDALAYAHEEGVVHQDVKPSNIIIDSREAGLLAIIEHPCPGMRDPVGRQPVMHPSLALVRPDLLVGRINGLLQILDHHPQLLVVHLFPNRQVS